ncbi:uncharacterized protein Dwil_GK14315 [Drosophila willistoni]|uniref:Protein takeout n=1 Tax=Drosophila willistoni TaxID=7260 RepID=B4NII2_DROWI|nr:circadian clock-controlled protein daywake [Drosophila willistoni]EDW84805.1 uncharacterized protein Dwil_GK14315 [Drosophila willistoni]
MRDILILAWSAQFFTISLAQLWPKEIKKCHYGDTECLVNTANAIIRKFPRGIPAIGLKPIDVVDIKDSKYWNDEKIGAFWLIFDLYQQVNYGFENTTITNIKGFDKNPTLSYMEIHGHIPNVIHKGRYMSQGRTWLVEMNSTGEYQSDFQSFNFTLKMKVFMEYRNHKRYLKMYELVPRVALNRWIFWLDNFFPDNSDLTWAINHVFNSNWIEFWNELEPVNLKIFAGIFRDLIADIFNNIAYDDMFLPDETETEVNV